MLGFCGVCCVCGGGGVCACVIWHWQSILWMGQSVSLEPAKGDKDDTALAVQFIKTYFNCKVRQSTSAIKLSRYTVYT